MGNPLDEVTQDLSQDDGNPLRRVYINGSDAPGGGSPFQPQTTNAPLAQAIAPPQDDIMTLIGKVREYMTNPTGFSAGTKVGNRLTGLGGEERYQTWPERMIRSGATLPGDVISEAEPIIDPETGRTSERVIERAMDTAGLAGGGALTERPGVGTLGSGPVRPGKEMKPSLVPAIKWEGRVYKDEPGVNHVDMVPPKLQKFMDKNGYDQVHDIPENTPGFGIGFVNHKGHFLSRDGDAAAYAAQYPELIVPEARDLVKQGAMSSDFLTFSDTSKPGAAVSAAASSGPAPVFYSALEHAATNAKQDVMSPGQWLGTLKNTPGVKAEELAWTGLPEWLAGQKGKVSKKDVQAYLDEHKVEIKDVTKKEATDGNQYSNREYDDATDHALEVMGEEFNRLPASERAKYDNDIDAWLEEPGPRNRMTQHETDWLENNSEGLDGPNATKYSSYQLPGGENYREHLLTMPRREPPRTMAKEPASAKQDTNGEWVIFNQDGHPLARYASYVAQDAQTAMQKYRDISMPHVPDDIKSDYGTQNYKSSHWDEPNVLAHVRTNDRDVGGQKSLHIEEIQSDWHQQGRKQGYKDGGKAEAEFVEANKAFRDAIRRDAPEDEIQPLREAAAAARNKADGLKSGVPDAPFKTTWPELALKRMIRHAAENGYDRISWTPGEAQAARYDLSKSIDVLHAKRNADGTYVLYGEMPNGRDLHQFGQNVPADKLADMVGKEVAQKIVDSKKDKIELEGSDLKVGGEGMREFYDKMLPKMAEKIGKAHGVKVKQTDINPVATKAKYSDQDKAWIAVDDSGNKVGISFGSKQKAEDFVKQQAKQLVHYFDLPQSLRDHAVGRGFPLYMSGIPFPLTPVDHDPFKKEK